jgi:soluble lytic murein transglycosylase
MKLRWLRWLADRGDWQTFVKVLRPQAELHRTGLPECQYQISHNLKAEGYANTEQTLADRQIPTGRLRRTVRHVGRRRSVDRAKTLGARQACRPARNYPLANSLANGLTTLAPRGRLLIDVAQKPELLNQPSRFTPADEAMSDVVSLGLRRLARQDPDKAMACSMATPAACTFPVTKKWRSPVKSA